MSKQRHKPKPSPFFDGPAIHRCPTFEAMLEDARIGSLRLRLAIENAGLRP